ncbi:YncE family protein [Cysteiniphilum sp. 6C5]|uniref:YncE family protein n=2 Tax=Cysteiniphilum TaxID=2056696 RepID=UPI003F8544E2
MNIKVMFFILTTYLAGASLFANESFNMSVNVVSLEDKTVDKSAQTDKPMIYVTNRGATNKVLHCDINNAGNVVHCKSLPVFNELVPDNVVVYQRKLYMFGKKLALQCPLSSSGSIIGCMQLDHAAALPLDYVPSNMYRNDRYAIFTSFTNGDVVSCQFDSNDQLESCHKSSDKFAMPTGIAVDEHHQFAYVVNSAPSMNSILRCNIDAVTATLSNCAKMDRTLMSITLPMAIAFNGKNKMIYIVDHKSSTVSRCQRNSSGDFVSCQQMFDVPLNKPVGMKFTSNYSKVYITNYHSDSLTRCNVNPAGDFIDCEAQLKEFLSSPVGLALSN